MIFNNKPSLWYVTTLPRLSSLCCVLYFWGKQQKQTNRKKNNTGQLSKHTYDQYIYWVYLGHSQVRKCEIQEFA